MVNGKRAFIYLFIFFFFFCRNRYYHGQIQDFLKEGAPQIRTDITSAPVGTGGVWEGCTPQKQRKFVIFKVHSHDLVHSFCLRRPIFAKNRGGRVPVAPPSKSAPDYHVFFFLFKWVENIIWREMLWPIKHIFKRPRYHDTSNLLFFSENITDVFFPQMLLLFCIVYCHLWPGSCVYMYNIAQIICFAFCCVWRCFFFFFFC